MTMETRVDFVKCSCSLSRGRNVRCACFAVVKLVLKSCGWFVPFTPISVSLFLDPAPPENATGGGVPPGDVKTTPGGVVVEPEEEKGVLDNVGSSRFPSKTNHSNFRC